VESNTCDNHDIFVRDCYKSMIGIISFLFVYGIVPYTVYNVVVKATGSRGAGVFVAIISVFATISLLEGSVRWLGSRIRRGPR
jgi:hypothetical protein